MLWRHCLEHEYSISEHLTWVLSLLLVQVPANACPGWWRATAGAFGSLPPTREPQMEFLASGFGLAPPQLSESCRYEHSKEKTELSRSRSFSPSQIIFEKSYVPMTWCAVIFHKWNNQWNLESSHWCPSGQWPWEQRPRPGTLRLLHFLPCSLTQFHCNCCSQTLFNSEMLLAGRPSFPCCIPTISRTFLWTKKAE